MEKLVCPGATRRNQIRSADESLIEVFVSSVKAYEQSSGMWKFAIIGSSVIDCLNVVFNSITGDIGASRDRVRTLFDNMPKLSVCLKPLATLQIELTEGAFTHHSWCYEMNSLNYYSEILIDVTHPVLNFAIWLQVTPQGAILKGAFDY